MREQISSSVYTISLISAPSDGLASMLVWDIKTGAIVKDIDVGVAGSPSRIVFSGHYTVTVVLYDHKTFRTYNALNGALLYKGESPLQSYGWLDVDQEHRESFRFASIGSNDGKPAININQLQPSSTPPCRIVESFIVPHHRCGLEVPFKFGHHFAFSLASFHASILTGAEITVLDVRDSKILLRTEAPGGLLWQGRFSPDGAFFAVRRGPEHSIRVWKNTSAGYTPWSCLKHRLPFVSFSFSPNGISTLAWSREGVQLLDNHTHIPSPNKTTPSHSGQDHRVAYSKDGTWIATARRGDNAITVLDALSGTPQRSITTATPILDIGIVGNTVIMAKECGLVRWDPEMGKTVHTAFGALPVETAVADTRPDLLKHFTLSTDCSWIAFYLDETIFLYDILDQRLYKYAMAMGEWVGDIRCAPHGRQLCFLLLRGRIRDRDRTLTEMVEQWRIVDVTKEFMEGERSRDGLFRLHGCCIGLGSEWIEDSGGKKLLWLSPNWRVKDYWRARFDGNFLALVEGRHPAPMIIAFQPQFLPIRQTPNTPSPF